MKVRMLVYTLAAPLALLCFNWPVDATASSFRYVDESSRLPPDINPPDTDTLDVDFADVDGDQDLVFLSRTVRLASIRVSINSILTTVVGISRMKP